ncbi:DUF87 domain-containing protein [Streptomyces sp. NPDC051909]|uniref:helicase HerA domain-containing protein n=1 Tax=Streptomyces sp. NPDC051909 TaxID=3154944 RepID=UPI0034493B8B
MRDLLAGMPESAPLIGLGANKKTVSVDLDHDSPHVLISAGTGGGKSTILRTIACQFLHNGAEAYILDFKRISHGWARSVPGVTYCRDIADIHDALLHLGHEGQRRIRLAEELGDDVLASEPEKVGPRIVILLEEINATMKQLARYWEKIRETGDPKTSPAVDALAEILFMGRQVRLHVLLVAQSATARALGGPEMRENFSTRILVRYTLNAWRMLVPEVHPAPKPTRHPGRVQVVLGGIARETQVLNLSEAEARAWAIAGAHATNMTAAATTVLSKPPAVEPQPNPAPTPPPTPSQPVPAGTAGDDLVGLRQAQRDLPAISLAALRWHAPTTPTSPARPTSVAPNSSTASATSSDGHVTGLEPALRPAMPMTPRKRASDDRSWSVRGLLSLVGVARRTRAYGARSAPPWGGHRELLGRGAHQGREGGSRGAHRAGRPGRREWARGPPGALRLAVVC